MADSYEFTGIGSAPDDGNPDFDGSMSYEGGFPRDSYPDSLDALNGQSDDQAASAIHREQRGCSDHQGGTNRDFDAAGLREKAPGDLAAKDLTQTPWYDDDLYHTRHENCPRTWKESDNTGEPLDSNDYPFGSCGPFH